MLHSEQGQHDPLQVEKMLTEMSAMEDHGTKGRPESAGGSPLEARVRNFERLATEVARLNFYAACGKAGIPSLPGKRFDHTLLVCMSPPGIKDVSPFNLYHSWGILQSKWCFLKELWFVQQLDSSCWSPA